MTKRTRFNFTVRFDGVCLYYGFILAEDYKDAFREVDALTMREDGSKYSDVQVREANRGPLYIPWHHNPKLLEQGMSVCVVAITPTGDRSMQTFRSTGLVEAIDSVRNQREWPEGTRFRAAMSKSPQENAKFFFSDETN